MTAANTTRATDSRRGDRAGSLHFVYAGICRPVGEWENTRCPHCRKTLVKRYGYLVQSYEITREGDVLVAPARFPVSGRSRRKLHRPRPGGLLPRLPRPWHSVRLDNERVWIIPFERKAFAGAVAARFIRMSRAGSATCLTLCLRARRPPRRCPSDHRASCRLSILRSIAASAFVSLRGRRSPPNRLLGRRTTIHLLESP